MNYHKYITVNPNPNNQWRGIGHQFLNFLVAHILSKKYDLKFIWQPFKGENDGTFALKGSNAFQIDQPVKLWNRFLSFDRNELSLDAVEGIEQFEIPMIDPKDCKWDHPVFKKLFEKEYLEDVLFVLPDHKDGMFIHIDWDTFNDNSLNCLRNKYHLAKSKQPACFDYLIDDITDSINIALHRRAGDVSENTPFNRWMPIDYYLTIIDNINKIEFNTPHNIHIYSYDMNPKEEKRLSDKQNVIMHINENTFDSFYNMVNFDVLINGQSSFSIMAAYLSYGIKLCTPWHTHWNNFPDQYDLINIDSDGNFDFNKLLKSLENKNENI
jgi:hypothetical protein